MEKAYLITEKTDLNKDFSEYSRLYIWDAFCEYNFLYFFKSSDFLKKIFSLKKNLTIVTPLISNKNIDNIFNIITKLNKFKKLEVVVNDNWLLYKIYKNNIDIDIIWWNFLITQEKDPYYLSFDVLGSDRLTIDSEIYTKYFLDKNIWMIELYNVFQWIVIDNNFNSTLYYPYVIYWVTRYCPMALIAKGMDCLTIVDNCDWCKWKTEKYLKMDLVINNRIVENFYSWNKQFYKNEKLNNHSSIKRIVYNYDVI